ncbi:MAG: response regulator [Leptolyngbya sp. SIO1D8]|nr:response regulator [Leptolyngbya sp. SIO1D8]
MKILLVEDDEILVANLAANLASQNYVVESATDGQLGWDYAQATRYDIIVLDVNLPGLDGISLCRQLRQTGYDGAILLLTAKADSRYKVSGLDAGADDYVVKPCPIDELSARIRALLRRPQGIASPILQWGALQLNPSTCQVYFAEQNISLSPKEYGLLELFLRNPQRVFSSAMLLERLWGFDEMPGEETVRTHIKRLRRKLKRAGADGVIENIYGMGYRLMPAPYEDTTQANVPAPSAFESTPAADVATTNRVNHKQSETTEPFLPTTSTTTSEEATQTAARQAAFAALRQFSGVIASRLAILDEAIAALQTASLSDELQQQAQQAAHKLVGSLGMFGFSDGSDLSREIEIGFQGDRTTIDSQQIGEWVSQLHQTLDDVLDVTADVTSMTDVKTKMPQSTEYSGMASNHLETEIPSAASLPLLIVVSSKSKLAASLQEIAQSAIQIMQVKDLLQVQEQFSESLTTATVLLDITEILDWKKNLSCLTDLAKSNPNLSVLALTAGQDTFETRLELTRCCRCMFLPRSAPSTHILESVLDSYQRGCSSTPHILAVDDDPLMLKALERQLSPWGMQVSTLNDSRQLWDVLPQLNPDLLMLDIEMPHVEGIELCQVIRSDRYWNRLPILFLTARRDTETVLQMYRAGADDYVAKPFTEPELVTRILNRLDRNYLAKQPLTIDPITGLMLEQQALQDIHRNFTLAQRHRQPYCLALIAIDSLESLSDSGQSWLSNQLIRNMADNLSERLRQEDIVAQAAPNVFLLGMYGIYKQQAGRRIELLLQELNEIAERLLGKNALKLSFKAGLAASPEEGESIPKLRQLAEANLSNSEFFNVVTS